MVTSKQVQQGKLGEERQVVLMDMIDFVRDGAIDTIASYDVDIKFVQEIKQNRNVDASTVVLRYMPDSCTVEVDMLLYQIDSCEDDDTKMMVQYAACLQRIQNASIQQEQRAYDALNKIIDASLQGLQMKGDVDQLENMSSVLKQQGQIKMQNLLQQNADM